MLTEEESAFMIFWESVRVKESQFGYKLLKGLPVALIFTLPILMSLLSVYLFAPSWYAKISAAASGVFGTLIVALVICTFFIAYFRMQFRWEKYEQMYSELKFREESNQSNN